MAAPVGMGLQQTTDYRVVLPFYYYAASAFLIATVLLLFNTDISSVTYFHGPTLALTHTMALGWGTMMIFGASHQLLPVLIEGKIYSKPLAYITFALLAVGLPILIVGFYYFDPVDSPLLLIGASLANGGVLLYLINVILSSLKSERRSIHAWFVITAAIWLFTTTIFGLLLVINFNESSRIFTGGSLSYLTLHAHLGLVGWFLMLIFGVGSRLIPLFLISKYTNNKLLWAVFWLTNAGLLSFIALRLWNAPAYCYYISILLILFAVGLFGRFCYKAYTGRIRKKVDYQVRTSLLSVAFMLLPILSLISILAFLPVSSHPNIPILYGFFIFFGWITAIIMGMTFKTLPFIVWNKVYDKKRRARKTLAPKDLFSEKIYRWMLGFYLSGFIVFTLGIIFTISIILKLGAVLLLISAGLYVFNVFKTLMHKPLAS